MPPLGKFGVSSDQLNPVSRGEAPRWQGKVLPSWAPLTMITAGAAAAPRPHVACTEKRHLVAEMEFSENALMYHFTCNFVGFWILG